MTREGWRDWGEIFGWELVRVNADSAEFRVPNDQMAEGHEYISISEQVSEDIMLALDTASEAAAAAFR